jgi:hypothetical protein
VIREQPRVAADLGEVRRDPLDDRLCSTSRAMPGFSIRTSAGRARVTSDNTFCDQRSANGPWASRSIQKIPVRRATVRVVVHARVVPPNVKSLARREHAVQILTDSADLDERLVVLPHGPFVGGQTKLGHDAREDHDTRDDTRGDTERAAAGALGDRDQTSAPPIVSGGSQSW